MNLGRWRLAVLILTICLIPVDPMQEHTQCLPYQCRALPTQVQTLCMGTCQYVVTSHE